MKRVAVVGSGPAGCVAVQQLVNAGCEVHLFERGAGRDEFTDQRKSANFFRASGEVGLLDAMCVVRPTAVANWTPYPQGNALGGTSAINAMVQMWGSPEDFQHWERDLGCSGWGWKEVRREYNALGMPRYFPEGTEQGAFSARIVEASIAMGATACRHESATGDGAGLVALSMRAGERLDAFDVFVAPLLVDPTAREQLHVRSHRAVHAVLIENGVACGLLFDDDTQEHFDAVLLCAGAIWSPLLLRRSGLQREGIGQNLKDHASLAITVQMSDPRGEDEILVTSLVVASSAMGDSDLHLLPSNAVTGANGSMSFAQLTAAIAVVSSKGMVEEVNDRAEVTLNSLATHDDSERMVSVLRLAHDVLRQEQCRQGVVECYVDNVGTTLEHLMAHDAEAIAQFVRRQVGPYSHVSGTCAMGQSANPNSVVGLTGAVHGVTGLWVGDASVFPDIPRAATQMPTTMVARRIARGLAESIA